jgi:solute carrier family 25 citrate transporter 1
VDCLVSTIRTQGIFSIYRGLTAMVLGTATKASIRFVSFERFKAILVDEQGRLSGPRAMLAGICEAVFAVTPSEAIK